MQYKNKSQLRRYGLQAYESIIKYPVKSFTPTASFEIGVGPWSLIVNITQ